MGQVDHFRDQGQNFLGFSMTVCALPLEPALLRSPPLLRGSGRPHWSHHSHGSPFSSCHLRWVSSSSAVAYQKPNKASILEGVSVGILLVCGREQGIRKRQSSGVCPSSHPLPPLILNTLALSHFFQTFNLFQLLGTKSRTKPNRPELFRYCTLHPARHNQVIKPESTSQS
jgi:hypothetical protein